MNKEKSTTASSSRQERQGKSSKSYSSTSSPTPVSARKSDNSRADKNSRKEKNFKRSKNLKTAKNLSGERSSRKNSSQVKGRRKNLSSGKVFLSSTSFQELPQTEQLANKADKSKALAAKKFEEENQVQDHREHFAPPPGLADQEEYRTPVVTLTATIDDQDRRLDNFMISILPNVPKSTWYRLFRKGEIRVNKKRVKADYKISLGDQIRIAPLVLVKNPSNKPELEDLVKLNSIKLLQESIIYEDKYLIALNKPSGIAVHGGSGLNFGVIEALRVLMPKEKRLELVHRIDRDTSGILLIAKRPTPLKVLQEQFRDKTISKQYLCMMPGQWVENQVNAPLLRYEKFGERFVKVDDEGKASTTNFTLLSNYKDKNARIYSLVEARPLTGRTHQIRVHALHALNPLLGDSKYNDRDELNYEKSLGLERLFLHAAKITFRHPVTEELLEISADLPPELANFLASLEKVD